jgi:RNA polymerase sigma-70 factor (ECF subfamily)
VDTLRRLALQAGRGDAAALDAVLAATYPQVRRLCLSFAGPADADDVTQDAMMRLVGALPAYRAGASVRTWALSIARHACLDHRRAASRRVAAVGRALAERPRSLECLDDTVAADRLVDGLGPDRREAFVLTQVLGLTYAEAAEVCGCPVGTVRSRVARARADLVAMLVAAEAGADSA